MISAIETYKGRRSRPIFPAQATLSWLKPKSIFIGDNQIFSNLLLYMGIYDKLMEDRKGLPDVERK
jgi:hypothetical protein